MINDGLACSWNSWTVLRPESTSSTSIQDSYIQTSPCGCGYISLSWWKLQFLWWWFLFWIISFLRCCVRRLRRVMHDCKCWGMMCHCVTPTHYNAIITINSGLLETLASTGYSICHKDDGCPLYWSRCQDIVRSMIDQHFNTDLSLPCSTQSYTPVIEGVAWS